MYTITLNDHMQSHDTLIIERSESKLTHNIIQYQKYCHRDDLPIHVHSKTICAFKIKHNAYNIQQNTKNRH